jgi:hypothetical protein
MKQFSIKEPNKAMQATRETRAPDGRRSARTFMRSALLLLLLCSQLGHAATDAIDALISGLNDSHGLWRNGSYPTIHLPSSASMDAVVEEAFGKVGFKEGRVEHYTVVSARSVYLDGHQNQEYYALLIDTNLGRKVLLMRYEGDATGWWTRFYDAEL